MDGWTDGQIWQANTRFSQLLNEMRKTDFFKCELARYNCWDYRSRMWRNKQILRFLVPHALLTLFLLVVQADVLVHRTGAATCHAVSEVSQVHSQESTWPTRLCFGLEFGPRQLQQLSTRTRELLRIWFRIQAELSCWPFQPWLYVPCVPLGRVCGQ